MCIPCSPRRDSRGLRNVFECIVWVRANVIHGPSPLLRSTGKAVALSSPVAHVWPDFTQKGKSATIEDVLRHQARIRNSRYYYFERISQDQV